MATIEFYQKKKQQIGLLEIETDEHFPIINTIEHLKKHIYLHHLYIHPIWKNDFVYYGLMIYCPWDDEGLGVLMYKDEVLGIGDYLDAKYGTMITLKHNGIFDLLKNN